VNIYITLFTTMLQCYTPAAKYRHIPKTSVCWGAELALASTGIKA